jgi:hypothetical protein
LNDFYDIIGLLLWALMLGVYLLPTLVAWVRDHRKLYAIAAMNVMLGWTILGWIGALIWALTAKEPLQQKKSSGHHHRRKSRTRTQAPVGQSDLASTRDSIH